jgi:hypothetical protein
MTWFLGLRQSGAVRQLRVPAGGGQVRQRLTDSDRRERGWWRQADQREDICEPRAERLPDGGLRCRDEWVQGRLVSRFTTEDVAVTENMIERVHRGELARPRMMPVRWVISERISIEPAVNETGITVRVLVRMAGLSHVLYLLGYRDTTTARRLTELARLQAVLTSAVIAARFRQARSGCGRGQCRVGRLAAQINPIGTARMTWPQIEKIARSGGLGCRKRAGAY